MEETREAFVIDSDEKADWAVRKIKEHMTDAERWEAFYKEQAQKIKTSAQQSIEYLSGGLYSYFATVPHRETKTQEKYKLPSGELVLMKEKEDFERDNGALLQWCKANHPELVRVKEEPDWNAVKAYIKETGELPEGVTPIQKPPEFKVR